MKKPGKLKKCEINEKTNNHSFGANGAVVAGPGTYSVKLTVNVKTYTGQVKVRQDPMLK